MSGRVTQFAGNVVAPGPSMSFFGPKVGPTVLSSVHTLRRINRANKNMRRAPPIQAHPALKDLGRHIEDHPTKRRYQMKTFNRNVDQLRTQFPHLTGRIPPLVQRMRTPERPGQHSGLPQYPVLKHRHRMTYINLRPDDEVRVIAGGVIGQNSKHLFAKDGKSRLYKIKEVDPTRNIVKLVGLTQPVHQVLPRDRNHSTMPLGAEGYQKVDQQEIPIPFANIQLLIPREAVVAQLKTPYGPNQEVLWTEAREKSLPEQIFATKLEERNIIAPDDRSRIFAHEKTGTYPWEWTLDEKELAGKPRLYQWDRYATETEPAMDPRIRVDINVPIKEVKIRKRPDEVNTPHPLATPSSIVLAKTWSPPPLPSLGAILNMKDRTLPNAYLSSLSSAASYAAASYPPSDGFLNQPIPARLTPEDHLPAGENDDAYTAEEMEERRTMWQDEVKENKRLRDLWTKGTAEWKAAAMEDSLDPTLPMEFFVGRELSNYFGPAKMKLRYEARNRREAAEKVAFVADAVEAHQARERRIRRGEEPRVGRVMGRDEVVLTAERRYAEMWVDRQHAHDERKAFELREKWGPSKFEVKKLKKEDKKRGLASRLRQILLVPAKNQVIPEGLLDPDGKHPGGRPGGEGRKMRPWQYKATE